MRLKTNLSNQPSIHPVTSPELSRIISPKSFGGREFQRTFRRRTRSTSQLITFGGNCKHSKRSTTLFVVHRPMRDRTQATSSKVDSDAFLLLIHISLNNILIDWFCAVATGHWLGVRIVYTLRFLYATIMANIQFLCTWQNTEHNQWLEIVVKRGRLNWNESFCEHWGKCCIHHEAK